MSEKKQFEKYTKSQSIALYVFFFIWSTMMITGGCHAAQIIKNHFFLYLVFQVIAYVIAYFMARNIISNGYSTDENTPTYTSSDMSARNTTDICTGIAPHGYWWHTNTTTHNYDPFINTSTSSTYSSTNRD